MKKVISIKETIIILISVLIITAFAITSVSAVSFDNPDLITERDYNLAQTIPDGNKAANDAENRAPNNIANNSTNNKANNTKVYNTNNTTDLPQTGIEDYNIGILLIICIASAIFAYKKVNDYRSL